MNLALPGIRSWAAAAAILAAVACSPIYESHGYAPSEAELRQLAVGGSGKGEVANAIGQPMVVNDRYGDSWFYVRSRFRIYGMEEAEVVDRSVVVVSFDESGIVSNVERYSLADGKAVALSRRVTETNLGRLNIVEQLLRSVGRVDPAAILAERQ